MQSLSGNQLQSLPRWNSSKPVVGGLHLSLFSRQSLNWNFKDLYNHWTAAQDTYLKTSLFFPQNTIIHFTAEKTELLFWKENML